MSLQNTNRTSASRAHIMSQFKKVALIGPSHGLQHPFFDEISRRYWSSNVSTPIMDGLEGICQENICHFEDHCTHLISFSASSSQCFILEQFLHAFQPKVIVICYPRDRIMDRIYSRLFRKKIRQVAEKVRRGKKTTTKLVKWYFINTSWDFRGGRGVDPSFDDLVEITCGTRFRHLHLGHTLATGSFLTSRRLLIEDVMRDCNALANSWIYRLFLVLLFVFLVRTPPDVFHIHSSVVTEHGIQNFDQLRQYFN